MRVTTKVTAELYQGICANGVARRRALTASLYTYRTSTSGRWQAWGGRRNGPLELDDQRAMVGEPNLMVQLMGIPDSTCQGRAIPYRVVIPAEIWGPVPLEPHRLWLRLHMQRCTEVLQRFIIEHAADRLTPQVESWPLVCPTKGSTILECPRLIQVAPKETTRALVQPFCSHRKMSLLGFGIRRIVAASVWNVTRSVLSSVYLYDAEVSRFLPSCWSRSENCWDSRSNHCGIALRSASFKAAWSVQVGESSGT